MTLSRRRFVALTAAGAAVAMTGGLTSACGVGGGKSEGDFKFITPFGLDLSFAPLLHAEADGAFADASLDVEFVDGKGSSQAITQVIAGSADIGQAGALDVIRAIATTEAPIIAFATIDQASPFSWISPANAPLRKAEDFVGKTVGVVSVGGTTEAYLDIMLGLEGIDPGEVPRQAVGEAAGTAELMKRGDLAGFIASADTVSLLTSQGEDVVTVPVDDIVALPGQVYFVTEKTLKERKDSLAAFLQVAYDSIEKIQADESGETTAATIAKKFKGQIPELDDLTASGEAIRARLELWESQGSKNLLRNVPKLWASGLKDVVDSGFVTTDVAATAMYTNDLADGIDR